MESLIEPLYRTNRANEPITLGFAPVEITCGGRRQRGNGEAILQLQPRLAILIKASFPGYEGLHATLSRDRVLVRYGEHSTAVSALVQHSTIAENSELVLAPQRQSLTISPHPRSRLSAVTFHILNFPNFFCQSGDLTHKYPRGGGRALGRVILVNAPWQIEIQAQLHTSDLVKDLAANGGYGLTHVGRLRRIDGRTFTVLATQRALFDLYQLLSFARGAWSPPILAVGFDSDGRRLWEDWTVRTAVPWEPRSSWFDAHHGDALADLYPRFVSLMRDPLVGKATSSALYWYLRGNRAGEGAGVDSGIILGQAALERLATAQLANVSSQSVKSNAADRLRSAMKLLKLPTAIPRVAAPVYNARRKKVWQDLPEAITRIRNELVHPKAKLPIPLRRFIPDVWRLTQWSIELWLLRLCDYNGVYSNRLRSRWIGEVERVPWARMKTPKP